MKMVIFVVQSKYSMKKTRTLQFQSRLFLFLLLFSAISVKKADGQWVYVPDANFRTAIATQIDPAAISGDSLDTSNPNVMNAKDLELSNKQIEDLEGLE